MPESKGTSKGLENLTLSSFINSDFLMCPPKL